MAARTWLGLTLVTGLAFAAPPLASAQQATPEMRAFSRVLVALEANNQAAYCVALHDAPYIDYLARVCQAAVQNRLRNAEECLQERLLQEARASLSQCQAMPAAEFDKVVLRAAEARSMFMQEAKAQDIDAQKLLDDARATAVR